MKSIILYTLCPELIPEIKIETDISKYENEADILIIDISSVDINKVYNNKLLYKGMIIENHVLYEYEFSGSKSIVYLEDVICFESDHRQVLVIFVDGHMERFYKKLDDVQKEVDELCDFFVRCSKSLYINYMYMDIKGYNITMSGGRKVEVTRGYRDIFKEKISRLWNK